MPIINGVYVSQESVDKKLLDKPLPTNINIPGMGIANFAANAAATAANKAAQDRQAQTQQRREEDIKRTQEVVASAKERLSQSQAETTPTPRKPVEDRIKEIEARQAAMSPQQRRQDLLTRVGNMETREKQEKIKSNEVMQRIDRQTAERIRTNPDMDADTRIAQTRRLAERGVYVFPGQKERAEANQEFGIIAVRQGNQPTQLQDLRRAGKPGLMSTQEIINASSRFDRYHERMKQINRQYNSGGRMRTNTGTPLKSPSTSPQTKTPGEEIPFLLRREAVENYKNQLNESIGAKVGQKAAQAVKYLTGPGGFVPKIVDPVFDVVKWAARKVGIAGPAAGKAIRRTNQATRAAVRVGVPVAIGAAAYKAAGPAAEVIFPSPGGGGRGIDAGSYGYGGGGGRRFSSSAGMSGLRGRGDASERRRAKHQDFMGRVATSRAAREERDVLIKTQMAQTGADRRRAIAELEKNADFNRLTSAGRRFQSGSTTRVVSTGPTSARDESAATKRGRLAQRVGDLAFRPPRNQDEKDRLTRAQQDLDAAYTEAEKQGKMIGYEDQGSLYSGLDRRGVMSPGGGTPITNGKKK